MTELCYFQQHVTESFSSRHFLSNNPFFIHSLLVAEHLSLLCITTQSLTYLLGTKAVYDSDLLKSKNSEYVLEKVAGPDLHLFSEVANLKCQPVPWNPLQF